MTNINNQDRLKIQYLETLGFCGDIIQKALPHLPKEGILRNITDRNVTAGRELPTELLSPKRDKRALQKRIAGAIFLENYISFSHERNARRARDKNFVIGRYICFINPYDPQYSKINKQEIDNDLFKFEIDLETIKIAYEKMRMRNERFAEVLNINEAFNIAKAWVVGEIFLVHCSENQDPYIVQNARIREESADIRRGLAFCPICEYQKTFVQNDFSYEPPPKEQEIATLEVRLSKQENWVGQARKREIPNRRVRE